MNTNYSETENIMSDSFIKPTSLIIPQGDYILNEQIVFQGNYNIILEGVLKYKANTNPCF